MLDVLFYLLDNFLLAELSLISDYGILSHELEAAGFEQEEIGMALGWLKDVSLPEDLPPPIMKAEPPQHERIFTNAEKQKLDPECQGFLMSLRQVGILSLEDMELIIDRATGLEEGIVSLGQLKWLTLMSLCNREFTSNTPEMNKDFNHLLFQSVLGGPH